MSRLQSPQARKTLFLLGLTPLSVVLAYTLKVALMLSQNGDGRDRFAAEDYGAAAGSFNDSRDLNLLEPWVATFDEAAALHADGDLTPAIETYLAALRDVPAEQECLVVVNLALAYEAVGVAEVRGDDPDRDAAVDAWEQGVAVLAEADCLEDGGTAAEDAAAVDLRLRQRVSDATGTARPERDPEQRQDDQRTERERQRNDQELGRLNRDGEEDRSEGEEFNREQQSEVREIPRW